MVARIVKLPRDLYPWEESLLNVCELYLVGGCVRDILMGHKMGEIDEDYLVRRIELEDLINRLKSFGKTESVGKAFGVIKFKPHKGVKKLFDISLPRKESSLGVEHKAFKVEFDPLIPVEEDLPRRDFTINSMAINLKDFTLVDPLDGAKDLQRGLLRMNSESSFSEDPLRILRGVQFMARFGLVVEDKTKEAMARYSKLIETVPPERIKEELNKLLLFADEPGDGFLLMHETGVLGIIMPEVDETYGIEQNEYHPDDVFMHSIKTMNHAPKKLYLRWAALLHDVGKKKMKTVVDGRIVFYGHQDESARLAEEILGRLRYSKKFIGRVKNLILNHMFNLDEDSSDSAIGRFIRKVGLDDIDALLELRKADMLSRGEARILEEVDRFKKRLADYMSKQNAFSVKDLAVSGTDVMGILDIPQGPEVGVVLSRLFEKVAENPELNKREKLLEILESMKSK